MENLVPVVVGPDLIVALVDVRKLANINLVFDGGTTNRLLVVVDVEFLLADEEGAPAGAAEAEPALDVNRGGHNQKGDGIIASVGRLNVSVLQGESLNFAFRVEARPHGLLKGPFHEEGVGLRDVLEKLNFLKIIQCVERMTKYNSDESPPGGADL
jgi:hypothetical protein